MISCYQVNNRVAVFTHWDYIIISIWGNKPFFFTWDELDTIIELIRERRNKRAKE